MKKFLGSKISGFSKFLFVSLSIAGLLFLSIRLDLLKLPTTQAAGGFEMTIYPGDFPTNAYAVWPVIALHANEGFSANINLTFTSVNLPSGTTIILDEINDQVNYQVAETMTLSQLSKISQVNIPLGTGSGEPEWNFLSPTIFLPYGYSDGTYTMDVSASGGGYTKTGQIRFTRSTNESSNDAYNSLCGGGTQKKEVNAGSQVSFNMCTDVNYTGTISLSSEKPSVTGLSTSFSTSSLDVHPTLGNPDKSDHTNLDVKPYGEISSNPFTFSVSTTRTTTSYTPNGYYLVMVKNSQPDGQADYYSRLRVKVNNSGLLPQEEQTTNNNQQTTTNNQQTTTSNQQSTSTSDTSNTSTSTPSTTTPSSKATTALATRGTAKVEEDSTAVLTLDKSSSYPGSKVTLKGEKFQKNKELVILWDPYTIKVDNQETQKSKYDFKNSDGSILVITTDKDGKFTQEITTPSNMISGHGGTHIINVSNKEQTEIYARIDFTIGDPTEEDLKVNPEAKPAVPLTQVAAQTLYQKSTQELSEPQKASTDIYLKAVDDNLYAKEPFPQSINVKESVGTKQIAVGLGLGENTATPISARDLGARSELVTKYLGIINGYINTINNTVPIIKSYLINSQITDPTLITDTAFTNNIVLLTSIYKEFTGDLGKEMINNAASLKDNAIDKKEICMALGGFKTATGTIPEYITISGISGGTNPINSAIKNKITEVEKAFNCTQTTEETEGYSIFAIYNNTRYFFTGQSGISLQQFLLGTGKLWDTGTGVKEAFAFTIYVFKDKEKKTNVDFEIPKNKIVEVIISDINTKLGDYSKYIQSGNTFHGDIKTIEMSFVGEREKDFISRSTGKMIAGRLGLFGKGEGEGDTLANCKFYFKGDSSFTSSCLSFKDDINIPSSYTFEGVKMFIKNILGIGKVLADEDLNEKLISEISSKKFSYIKDIFEKIEKKYGKTDLYMAVTLKGSNEVRSAGYLSGDDLMKLDKDGFRTLLSKNIFDALSAEGGMVSFTSPIGGGATAPVGVVATSYSYDVINLQAGSLSQFYDCMNRVAQGAHEICRQIDWHNHDGNYSSYSNDRNIYFNAQQIAGRVAVGDPGHTYVLLGRTGDGLPANGAFVITPWGVFPWTNNEAPSSLTEEQVAAQKKFKDAVGFQTNYYAVTCPETIDGFNNISVSARTGLKYCDWPSVDSGNLDDLTQEEAYQINNEAVVSAGAIIGYDQGQETGYQVTANVLLTTDFTGEQQIGLNKSNKSLVDISFSGKALAADETTTTETTTATDTSTAVNSQKTNYVKITTKDHAVGLLITDPLGRHIGWNSLGQKTMNQIEGAYYDYPLESNSTIYLPNVLEGDYIIRVIGLEDSRYDVTVQLAALDKIYTKRFAGDVKQNEIIDGNITTAFTLTSTLSTQEKITQWFKDFFSNRYNVLYTVLLALCLLGGIWVAVRVVRRRRLGLSR